MNYAAVSMLSRMPLFQAAYHGVSVNGGTLYCTHQPCVVCTKILINAGIERIVYANPYPDKLAEEMLKMPI